MGIRRTLGLTVAAVLATAVWGVGAVSGVSGPRGVVTYAEAPGANPNYIFPFASCQYASSNNINQFQMLMYRPLYWFGLGSSTTFAPAVSLALAPKFTNGNRTVTITLKGWRFADGQLVNARSVMFFLNMYRADPTAYCGYNAGFGIPDQVASASGTGETVRINFTTPVNPNWTFYNYLSEITPLPDLWDRTSPTQRANCAGGAFGAASTKTSCTAVVSYLSSLAAETGTFTGKLWQAQVLKVQERAYRTSQAEQSDLIAGRLSIGYLDPSALTSPAPPLGQPSANWAPLSGHYTMTVGNTWSFNLAALNFSTADPKSAAINQLYIRQALQQSIDQNSLIQTAFKGYGSPVYSPLPPQTPAVLAKPFNNPYPFDPVAAQMLLVNHGWTLMNGVLTCTSPGTAANQCGARIANGYTLNFNVVAAGGSPSLVQIINAEATSWRNLGIGITVIIASFNNVISDCSGGSGFEICAWGTGWTYEPNYYPSGESLFTPGGGGNAGGYSDPKMTTLVNASTYGKGTLTAYANYAAQQLPVLYQPQSMSIQETLKGLRSSVGLIPNPLGNFTPEYLHF